MSAAHAVSCLVLCFFLVGWSQGRRGHRAAHIVLMVLGMVIDIVLTLYLEMARGAVETAVGGASNFSGSRTLLLFVHVPLSLAVLLVCYPVSIFLGIKACRSAGPRYQAMRSFHRKWGLGTIALYTMSLLTAPRFAVDQLLGLF